MSKKLSQIEIEKKMKLEGIKRARKKTLAVKGRIETSAGVGSRLLSSSVESVHKAIQDWMERRESSNIKKRKAGLMFDTYFLLKKLDKTIGLKIVAAIAARSILDCISVHKKATRTAVTIATCIEQEWVLHNIEDESSQWFQYFKNNLGTSAKCTDKQTLIHRQRRIKEYMTRTSGFRSWGTWDSTTKVKLGTLLIELFCNSTLIATVCNRKDFRGRLSAVISPTPQTLDTLERWNAHTEVLKPIYKPCVISPAKWTNPFDGGFYSPELYQRPLIKTTDRQYLKDLEAIDMPDVYGPVNRMQETPWKINEDILGLIEEFWESNNNTAGLPNREDTPLPEKPKDIKTNKEARDNWRRAARDVYNFNDKQLSHRVGLLKTLSLAREYMKYDEFFFVIQLDWRGRAYPISYFYLQPQGPDFGKSLLLFKEGKPLHKESAKKWFKIHGANVFGKDKLPLEDRVKWVEDHEQDILNCALDPYHYNFWTKASEPWCFLAWCLEYSEWKENPETFLSHIPIAQDATQSGLQILSLLVLDQEGAESTNLTPTKNPKDLYQTVADETTRLLKEALETTDSEIIKSIKKVEASHKRRSKNPNFDPKKEERKLQSEISKIKRIREQAQLWLDLGIDRGMVKRPTMTYVYSASNHSMVAYLKEAALDKGLDIPKKHLYISCSFLGSYVRKAMKAKLVGAEKVMNYFSDIAKVTCSSKNSLHWYSPSGLLVKQSYFMMFSDTIKTKIDGIIRTRSIATESNTINKKKHRQGLSPNIIHSIDAGLMFMLISSMPKDTSFSMIHDSWGVHAADAELMAQNTRLVYQKVFSEPILKNIISEITAGMTDKEKEKLPEFPTMGSYDTNDLINAVYMFS